MTRKQREQKKEQLLKCLQQTLGIINTACLQAGVGRKTYYNWLNEDPDFKEKAEAIMETQKDVGEAALLKLIRDGDTAATIFYAKTKLKDRGYIERQEITGKDGEPFHSTIIQVPDNDTAKLLGDIQNGKK